MTTTAPAPPTRAVEPQPGSTWWLVHLATLVAGIPVLVWINRDQWFAGDEWDVVVNNGLGSNPTRAGLFAPHFEHWSTLGVLVYKAIYGVFALRTYVPYVAVLIVVLLALAHLTWRLLLRIGVVAPYATAVAALTIVLAVGWENRSNSWQITILAPVVFGFGALLVLPERGPWQRRDLAVSALLLLGLASSGVGVTMTVVVALAALLRRGWRVTLAIVAVPAAIYALWYGLEGTSGQRNSVALSDAVRDLPDFVWRGLTEAYSGLTRLPDTGVFVLAAMVVWVVWRARPRQEPWPIVIATTVGALVSIALTALRRSGAGSVPGASRYSDIVVLLSLPALALATQELGRWLVRRSGRAGVVVCSVVVLAFLVVQVVALDDEVSSEPFVGEMKPRVLSVARIMRDHEPLASTNIFGIPYLAEPSTTTIARLDRHGELPALDVSTADVLTAREYVETVIGDASKYPEGAVHKIHVYEGSATPTASGCVELAPRKGRSPRARLQLPAAGSFRVATARPADVALSLVEGDVEGRPREFSTGPGNGTGVGVSRASEVQLHLPATTTTTLCGLGAEASGSP